MNHFKTVSIAFFIAVILVSCSQIDVKSDYDPSIDFSKYMTFCVKRDAKIPGDKLKENNFTQSRIFSAIEKQMIKRGLREVAEEEADLVVLTYVGVQQKVNISTYGYSAGPYWGGYGYGGYGGTQTVVSHYNEGTVHIDVLDRGAKGLIWAGTGTGVMGETSTPREREELINDAVAQILFDFPPPK